MYPVTTIDLVSSWESCLGLPMHECAVMLLQTAFPSTSPESLAVQPIGMRDSLLMDFRKWIFGEEIEIVTQCPDCQESLEIAFPISTIHLPEAQPPLEPLSVQHDDIQVLYRLPNSFDLQYLYYNPEHAGDISSILKRCVLEARRIDKPVPFEELPETLLSDLAALMEEADPQGKTELSLSCAACDHNWVSLFDIVSFFWQELDNFVRHILQDVHIIASKYGWREKDILSMSPYRRRIYLNMIGQ